LLIYCYFRKVLTTEEEAENLKKRLAKAEGENAKLKEVVAKKEEDLLVIGQHLAVMECEASNASKARDRAQAELAKLFKEFRDL
jgi:chromosome segregation ATPase